MVQTPYMYGVCPTSDTRRRGRNQKEKIRVQSVMVAIPPYYSTCSGFAGNQT